jgi:hypothetical protein
MRIDLKGQSRRIHLRILPHPVVLHFRFGQDPDGAIAMAHCTWNQ